MPTIPTATITDPNSQWQINIRDLIAPGTRFYLNNNKLNYDRVVTLVGFPLVL